MTTISELFGRNITPEAKDCHTPGAERLSAPIRAKSDSPPDRFEAEVFNFLLANKEALAIEHVRKFTALMVDGDIDLNDGKQLTVEIKFRMNWMKACQAGWQFRTFVKRTDRKTYPVDGGLVVFQEFSNDWQRRVNRRHLENGWNDWYAGHSEVEGFRLDLLRLRDGNLEGFPISQIILATAASLPLAELSRLRASLATTDG